MTSARARERRALAPTTTATATIAATVIAATMVTSGCAQIITRSTVEVMPRTETSALTIGPPGREIATRGLEATWKQDGDRLALRLEESRTCNSVRYVPVVRIERVDRRTAGGAMWLEYGLGAGALAGGLVGLIRPELFSQATINTNGMMIRDKGTGYRIGGVLTGIGTVLLVAAIVDTVRTRDEVRYTDAYRRDEGGTIECLDPLVPMNAQSVELLVGEWSTVEPTSDDGGVRFLLPAVEELPDEARTVIAATEAWEAAKAEADAAAKAAEEEAARVAAEAEAAAAKAKRKRKPKAGAGDASGDAGVIAPAPAVELGPRPEPMVVKGVLRIDNERALAVSFVVPYGAEKAHGHEGRLKVEAAPGTGPAPGRGKGLSLKAGGEREGEANTTDETRETDVAAEPAEVK